MKQLRPIIEKPEYYELIEKTLNEYWDKIFYKPLILISRKNIKTLFNSKNTIRDALLSGRIQFTDNFFSGSFNSSIVKEFHKIGAVFDKRTGRYNINIKKLPFDIQSLIAVSKTKFETLNNDLLDYLDDLNIEDLEDIADKEELTREYSRIIGDLDGQYKASLSGITIEPNITPVIAGNLRDEYTENMRLYIRGWTEDNIINLREQVYKNTFEGYRAENLVKIILKNKNVSLNKAKFLARQETSLLTAQYRQERYSSIGVSKYKWRIRGFRTRPDHRILNDKIFTWDTPPITNRKTGARNHPGQDFNCYCTAIALAEF